MVPDDDDDDSNRDDNDDRPKDDFDCMVDFNHSPKLFRL